MDWPPITFDFSTTPTAKPARSYSPSAYMPGISAVSPVPQEIEHHDRDQQQIGQHTDDGQCAGLQGGQPGSAVLGGLLGEPGLQRSQVEVDADAESLLQ